MEKGVPTKQLSAMRGRNEMMTKLIFLSSPGALDPQLVFDVDVDTYIDMLYHPVLNEKLPSIYKEGELQITSAKDRLETIIKAFLTKTTGGSFDIPYGMQGRACARRWKPTVGRYNYLPKEYYKYLRNVPIPKPHPPTTFSKTQGPTQSEANKARKPKPPSATTQSQMNWTEKYTYYLESDGSDLEVLEDETQKAKQAWID